MSPRFRLLERYSIDNFLFQIRLREVPSPLTIKTKEKSIYYNILNIVERTVLKIYIKLIRSRILYIKLIQSIHFRRPTSDRKNAGIINEDMQRTHSSIPSFSKSSHRIQGKKIEFHHLEMQSVRISTMLNPETSVCRKARSHSKKRFLMLVTDRSLKPMLSESYQKLISFTTDQDTKDSDVEILLLIIYRPMFCLVSSYSIKNCLSPAKEVLQRKGQSTGRCLTQNI